ncbi:hypothetical protein BT69DRAFT_217474 [Atractiella rhizophila]|nr:hypothetical protein BT69DRAFT_217474 [Atractiella rhizophila]
MAQFVGLRVSVALHNSETLVGTLSSIDAVSGTVRLALSGQGGGKERVIKREEMKGLNVLDNAGGSGNGNAGPVTAASVGLSPSNTQQGLQTSPRPAQHLTPSPSPPTTIPPPQPQPLVPAPPDKERDKEKRAKRKGRRAGGGGREEPGSEEADESTRPFESDGWEDGVAALGGTKEKRKPQQTYASHPRSNRRDRRDQRLPAGTQAWKNEDVSNGYAEDFDFESGLKSFDKKKVYEQIRNHDGPLPSTPPPRLLVLPADWGWMLPHPCLTILPQPTVSKPATGSHLPRRLLHKLRRIRIVV